jgi:tripartite-type tricarboxylate transporter receptor subunit TctC
LCIEGTHIMKLRRRAFLQLAAGAVLSGSAGRAAAQGYPARPVRIIVGVAAGGANDTIARLMAQWLSERLGQQFVVENRPGAGGSLSAEVVASAPPDGYTLLFVTSANAIDASLYDKPSFNFIRDIAPVASILRGPLVMEVNPSFPAQTVPDFIAYAKAHPGALNMASAGNGNTTHVVGELFMMMTGISLVHVPYRGGAPALTDLLAGRVQVYFDGISGSLASIRAGKVRALAVTTARRAEVLPDVPSIAEFVPGYDASGWYGIGAPRGISAEIADRLNSAVNAALADPQFRTRLTGLGYSPQPSSSAEFGNFIAEETEKWRRVIKFAGIKLD